eukprot:TRINITY_DN11582_c0_g2_i2.p1 TRINITY_DN11582_c0_g2~~TRINITY_DN11582_c0_g2_i2.p1  ORF type:complete len:657 (-),score=115.16 TRINITY_DN11582_c0_g2_i2:83-2053(-)
MADNSDGLTMDLGHTDVVYLELPLGHGQHSITYEGFSKLTNKKTAVRVVDISNEHRESPDEIAKLFKDLIKLRNENIMGFYRAHKSPIRYYYIVKYCEHTSIDTLIGASDILCPENVVHDVMNQVRKALLYYLENKSKLKTALNPDIKLTRILVDSEFKIKVNFWGWLTNYDLQYVPGEEIASLRSVFHELLLGRQPIQSGNGKTLDTETINMLKKLQLSPQLEDLLRRLNENHPDRKLQLKELLNHEWFRLWKSEGSLKQFHQDILSHNPARIKRRDDLANRLARSVMSKSMTLAEDQIRVSMVFAKKEVGNGLSGLMELEEKVIEDEGDVEINWSQSEAAALAEEAKRVQEENLKFMEEVRQRELAMIEEERRRTEDMERKRVEEEQRIIEEARQKKIEFEQRAKEQAEKAAREELERLERERKANEEQARRLIEEERMRFVKAEEEKRAHEERIRGEEAARNLMTLRSEEFVELVFSEIRRNTYTPFCVQESAAVRTEAILRGLMSETELLKYKTKRDLHILKESQSVLRGIHLMIQRGDDGATIYEKKHIPWRVLVRISPMLLSSFNGIIAGTRGMLRNARFMKEVVIEDNDNCQAGEAVAALGINELNADFDAAQSLNIDTKEGFAQIILIAPRWNTNELEVAIQHLNSLL